jgi:hypothetical protein
VSGLPYQPAAVQSFAVQVRLARGLSPAQEAAFQRRVEAWLADRDLHMEGGQIAFGVVAERELSTIDQADVMIMLLDDATVRQARVGPLIGEQDDLSLEVTGLLWVEASQPDPLVDAARLLYEASRLSGAAFLKALGGYIYRTDEHPGVRP